MDRLIYIFVFCFLVSCSISKNKMIVSSEFIFQRERQGQCHSSTIVEKGNGELMAAWFAGSYSGFKRYGAYTLYMGQEKD